MVIYGYLWLSMAESPRVPEIDGPEGRIFLVVNPMSHPISVITIPSGALARKRADYVRHRKSDSKEPASFQGLWSQDPKKHHGWSFLTTKTTKSWSSLDENWGPMGLDLELDLELDLTQRKAPKMFPFHLSPAVDRIPSYYRWFFFDLPDLGDGENLSKSNSKPK